MVIQEEYLPDLKWGVSYRAHPLHLEVFAETGGLPDPWLYSTLDIRKILGAASMERAKQYLREWTQSVTPDENVNDLQV